MSMKKPQTPAPTPADRQRPLHTRKSAWKLGWAITRLRGQPLGAPEPARG
jgi:hypothetical protein